MKKRKLVSLIATSALVASQLVIPAAAATGTVTVSVDTETTVIRVEVPTMIKVAVNEFESNDAGSQIYSAPFEMKNKSIVPVKVDVSSLATVDSGVALKASPDAIANAGDAWLAVAAQTEAGKYGADIKDLTDTSANVTTFDTTGKKAEQTFYLGAGTGSTVNKMLIPDTDAVNAGVAAYGEEVYALTELTVGDAAGNDGSTFGDGTTDTTTDNDDVLTGLLTGGKVLYTVATAEDGAVLTKVPETETTYNGTLTYYEAGTTAANTLTSGSPYVYAEQATAGGAAAFRYIGKLSGEKTGGWTNSDITTVAITYDIQGVATSVYDGKKDDCVYGLYTAPAAAKVTSAKSVKAEAGKAVEFTVDLGAGSTGASGIEKVELSIFEGYNLLNKDNDVVFEDGKLTFPAGTIDYLLTDDEMKDAEWPLTFTVTFKMNKSGAEAIEETLTLTKN